MHSELCLYSRNHRRSTPTEVLGYTQQYIYLSILHHNKSSTKEKDTKSIGAPIIYLQTQDSLPAFLDEIRFFFSRGAIFFFFSFGT